MIHVIPRNSRESRDIEGFRFLLSWAMTGEKKKNAQEEMVVALFAINGGVAHLFVVSGYQGAEDDPDKLALSDQQLTAVLCAAHVCCARPPVIVAGDLNADPLIIPPWPRVLGWVDLDSACALGRCEAPHPTCVVHGLIRTTLSTCPNLRRRFPPWSLPGRVGRVSKREVATAHLSSDGGGTVKRG